LPAGCPSRDPSVFSQSGALCTAMLDLAENRHIGLSKLISIGNKADLSEIDMLSALARDTETRVIVGYLEDISSGDEFIKAAEDASNRKPVIILKSGTTRPARRPRPAIPGVLSGRGHRLWGGFQALRGLPGRYL
jgi:acetate---CoA ligase (ADP-forming)